MSPVDGVQITAGGIDDRIRLIALAERAQAGDSKALADLISLVASDVYRLALRILGHPQDAEDASQEALVRIVNRLGSFSGDASFRTWSYRVAVNHFLNVRRSRIERERLTFDSFAEQLLDGLESNPAERPDSRILAEEVKLGCTLAMLMCLDRSQRIAYILGDVFQLASTDAAYVIGTSAETYRKRLSRARSRVRAFMASNCGLVSSSAACRCDRRVPAAIRVGRLDPNHLMFADTERVHSAAGEMERLHDAASLMRSHPDYNAPASLTERVRDIVNRSQLSILDDPPHRRGPPLAPD